MKTNKTIQEILEMFKGMTFFKTFNPQTDIFQEAIKRGYYELEYLVAYEIEHYNCMSAIYDSPAESSTRYTITEVLEVNLYYKDELIELTDNELEQFKNLTYNKLKGYE